MLHKNVGDHLIAMQDTQVFILGDLILDTYVRGKVTRISPEAPVPVVLEQNQWAVLGGAANVAANISEFGGKALLAGRIGLDREGEEFLNLCQNAGIDVAGVVRNRELPTTRKLRIMAGYQQLVRVDAESTDELRSEEASVILKVFQKFLTGDASKALVISDYGKGVCTSELLRQVITLANAHGVPVITDPKSVDMKRYAGSHIIKPNLNEGREMLKILSPGARFQTFDEEIAAVCAAILEGAESRNVVLSLSERGVTVQGKDLAAPQMYSSTALQVADVSGAGDTMIAFLAMGAAAQLGIERSVKLANIAAGIVCGKLGTASVSASEFMQSFKDQTEDTAPEKVIDRGELAEILDQTRDNGKRVVFTNGCFDLLHAGHIEILQRSKSFGHILVVGLNSDTSVKRLKGESRPIQNQEDRARILAALACVDYVVIFDEDTPLTCIEQLRPDILVKGSDYKVDTVVGAKEVMGWGGRVELVQLLSGKSTTSMIQRSRQ